MAWVIGIGIGLVLLFAFPKQMGAVILLLVVGAAGLFGYLYIEEQRRDEEYRERQESVSISANFDAGRCSAEFPIIIKISNNNTETLLSLTFGFSGFREGHSSPVYEAIYVTSDRIIAPGQSYEACWAVPKLNYGAEATPPGTLMWKANPTSPTFGSPP